VLTWGLIGPGKGIEWAIQAFGKLQDLAPRPRYRVLGQTHPKVLANDGDAYRDRLVATVDALGLRSSITIDGRYLNPQALARNILVADIVLLPYDSRIQVTSGVLAEAVAAGKPVVATAFPHAKELLASGAGIIVPHESPSAIAAALRTILTDPEAAALMARTARRVGRETTWPEVGARFRNLALRLRSTVAA
jgi:glycosyltransferase involved in cell wall biosynthesis